MSQGEHRVFRPALKKSQKFPQFFRCRSILDTFGLCIPKWIMLLVSICWLFFLIHFKGYIADIAHFGGPKYWSNSMPNTISAPPKYESILDVAGWKCCNAVFFKDSNIYTKKPTKTITCTSCVFVQVSFPCISIDEFICCLCLIMNLCCNQNMVCVLYFSPQKPQNHPVTLILVQSIWAIDLTIQTHNVF